MVGGLSDHVWPLEECPKLRSLNASLAACAETPRGVAGVFVADLKYVLLGNSENRAGYLLCSANLSRNGKNVTGKYDFSTIIDVGPRKICCLSICLENSSWYSIQNTA